MESQTKKLISTNQKVALENFLNDPTYKDHLSIYNLDNAFTSISNMTEKQYKYLLVLFEQKNWFKIKSILDNFLKHK